MIECLRYPQKVFHQSAPFGIANNNLRGHNILVRMQWAAGLGQRLVMGNNVALSVVLIKARMSLGYA